MATGKYVINLDFQAKNLNTLKAQLNELMSTINSKGIELKLDKTNLGNIKKDFGILSSSLQNAFDMKSGKIDFNKVALDLKNSQINAFKLEGSLNRLGINGKNTFDKIYKAQYDFGTQVKDTTGWVSKLNFTLSNTARWRISNAALNAFTGKIQEAWYFAKDLDTALTDIQIVTGKTNADMLEFAQKAQKMANTLVSTTLDYTKASLVFFQQGLGTKEVEDMTRATIVGANITGESAEEMSTLLTSIMQGYKVSSEDMLSIVDKLSKVGATTAADFYELATAMSKVASIANTAGVPIDKLNAQIATIVSTTKEAPETVGTALKSMYARMLAFKSNGNAEMTDENGQVFSAPRVEKALQAFSGGKISMFDKTTGKLREMGDVIEEIGDAWETTGSKEAKMALVTAMAGTHHLNRVMALFNGWKQYKQAVEDSMDSEGTALQQQAVRAQSLEGRLKNLQNAFQGLYMSVLDSEGLKDIVDALTSVVNLLGKISTVAGGMPTLMGLGTGVAIRGAVQKPIRRIMESRNPNMITGISDANTKKTLTEGTQALEKAKRVYSEQEMKRLEDEYNHVIEINRAYQERENILAGLKLSSDTNLGIKEDVTKVDIFGDLPNSNIKLPETAKAFSDKISYIKEQYGNILTDDITQDFNKLEDLIKRAGNASNLTAEDLDKLNAEIAASKELTEDLSERMGKLAESQKKVAAAAAKKEFGTSDINEITEIQQANKDYVNNTTENFKQGASAMADISDKTIKIQEGISTATMLLTSFSTILADDTTSAAEKVSRAFGSMGTALLLNSEGIVSDASARYQELNEQFMATPRYAELTSTSVNRTTQSFNLMNLGLRRGLMGIKSFALGLGSAIPQLLAISAITFVVTKAFQILGDALPTLANAKKRLDEVNAELGSLNSELSELRGLTNPTDADLEKISILERQIELQKELNKEAKAEVDEKTVSGGLFDSGLAGKSGDIISKLAPVGTGGGYQVSDKIADLDKENFDPTDVEDITKHLNEYEFQLKSVEFSLNEVTDSNVKNSNEYKRAKHNITEGKTAIEEYRKQLIKQIGAEGDLATEIEGKTYSLGESTMVTDEATISTESLTESYDKLKTASDDLNNANKEYKDTGELSLDMVNDLLGKYPELTEILGLYLAKMVSAKDVIQELQGVYKTDEENWKQSLLSKMADSETFFTNIKGNNEIFFKRLKELYGIDLSNASTLAQAKYTIDTTLVSQLGAVWARYFDASTGALNSTYDNVTKLVENLESDPAYQLQKRLLPKGTKGMVEILQGQLDVVNEVVDKQNEAKKKLEDLALEGFGDFKNPVTSDSNKSKDKKKTFTWYETFINAQRQIIDQDQAVIAAIQNEIELAESLGDTAKVEELNNKLLEERKKLYTDLTAAQDALNKKILGYNASLVGKYNLGGTAEEVTATTNSWFNADLSESSAFQKLMNDSTVAQQKFYQLVFDTIQAMKEAYKDYGDTVIDVNKKIKTSYQEAVEKQKEQIESATEALTEIYEKYYDTLKKNEEDRHDGVMSNLDDEIDRINDKYDLVNKQNVLKDFDKQIAAKQAQIDALALDTSNEANARRRILQQELADITADKLAEINTQEKDSQIEAIEDLKEVEEEYFDQQMDELDKLSDAYAIAAKVKKDLESANTTDTINNIKAIAGQAGIAFDDLTDKIKLIQEGINAIQNPVSEEDYTTTPGTATGAKTSVRVWNTSGQLQAGAYMQDNKTYLADGTRLPTGYYVQAPNGTTYQMGADGTGSILPIKRGKKYPNYWLVSSDGKSTGIPSGALVVTGGGVYDKDTGKWVEKLKGPKSSYSSYYDLLQNFLTEYKEGGLVPTTGPIWADGTSTKPEYMLKNEHFESLLKAVQLSTDIIPSINSLVGQTINEISKGIGAGIQIDSDINIYQSDDEDTDTLVRRLKKELWADLDEKFKKKGLSAIR